MAPVIAYTSVSFGACALRPPNRSANSRCSEIAGSRFATARSAIRLMFVVRQRGG